MKRSALLLTLLLPAPLLAHPGGLDSNGCHHDRKNGGYHCHGGSSAPAPRYTTQPRPSSIAPVAPAAPVGTNAAPSAATNVDVWRTAETLLRALDYFSGTPDGLPDNVSMDALRRFRFERRLAPPAAGVVDGVALVRLAEELVRQLGQAESARMGNQEQLSKAIAANGELQRQLNGANQAIAKHRSEPAPIAGSANVPSVSASSQPAASSVTVVGEPHVLVVGGGALVNATLFNHGSAPTKVSVHVELFRNGKKYNEVIKPLTVPAGEATDVQQSFQNVPGGGTYTARVTPGKG